MDASAAGGAAKRSEIYTYEAPWCIYGLAASQRAGSEYRFALGSYVEEYSNKVQIIQLNEERNELVLRGSFDHPYPATKVMWAPEPLARERDLLATSGDYLRLWHATPSSKRPGDYDVKQEAVLNNVRTQRPQARRCAAAEAAREARQV